jgi:hypothetical protein
MEFWFCVGDDANIELAAAWDSRNPAIMSMPNVKLTARRHPIPRLSLKDNLWIQTLCDIACLLRSPAPTPAAQGNT